jgi:mono/diheme cytochrome c family protein
MWEEVQMRRSGVALAAVVVFAAASASAQEPELNDAQKLGQSLFVQSCGVCHLPPQLNAPRFAPALSRDSASGNENAMRTIITDGSPRMPGFKYQFTETQIAAIASYLKTVPPRAPDAPPPAKREGRDAD